MGTKFGKQKAGEDQAQKQRKHMGFETRKRAVRRASLQTGRYLLGWKFESGQFLSKTGPAARRVGKYKENVRNT